MSAKVTDAKTFSQGQVGFQRVLFFSPEVHFNIKVSAAVNSVDSSLCSGLDKLVDKV